GHVEAEVAQERDMVRLEVETKESGTETYSSKEKLKISCLLNKNPEGYCQTYEELEKALVGARKGDVVEVSIPPDAESAKGFDLKATVIKISRAKDGGNSNE